VKPLTKLPFRHWLRVNRAWLVNLYLFIHICAFISWQSYRLIITGSFNFVETSFIAQNIVLAIIVLIRRDHFAIDVNWWHQAVALTAFCSGIAFIGQPAHGSAETHLISQGIVASANLIGILALFHLGKSFGILIACRGIKSSGMYRLVRHPMYLSDILLRVGFTISHFSITTLTLALLSIALYVYRALLEERFLSAQPEYCAYMKKVRYRFLPGVF
jgi:protein-S-isoprenylcysteine O-methyltransferase Ste14